jgi:hypothetical protein
MSRRLIRYHQGMSRSKALLIAAFASSCMAQEQPAPEPATEAKTRQETGGANSANQTDKRIFGVLPNYRTVEDTGEVAPISARQKFTIAAKDSFDYPVYMLSGAFAGLSQIENQNPSFGQGLKGYAKRYGCAYGDQMLGNIMTEGLLPSVLHEDPRYFRRGTGGKWERARYALTRVFVLRTDSGGSRFNTSEWLGNSIAVAVSNAYYPDTRHASDNLQKLGMQVGTDAVSNVLKEFWPDVKRRFIRRSQTVGP